MKIWIFNFLLLLNLHIRGKELTEDSVNTKTESSPCQWDNDCDIQCLEGEYSRESYIESIQSLFNDRDECHSCGIKLTVPTDYFLNKTLQPNWLPVNMKIIDLEVDFNKIGVFQQNAFASGIFSNVKKFTIKNLWPEETLPKWTFNGLESLEILIFADAQLAVGWWITINISYGLLEFAKNTLNSLTLIERADSKNKSFLIQRMLGDLSAPLTNLEYVNIKYNLTVINSSSFSAITYVRVLDLSECFISAILEDTFDKLNKTLLILNLERNRLITLAEGTFMKLHLSSTIQSEEVVSETTLTIHLTENPWHCGCQLNFTKELLNEFSNFPGEYLCKTPEEIVNYPLRETEFCPFPITTVRTTPISTTTTEANYDGLIEKQCLTFNKSAADDKIFIQSQIQQLELIDKDGDVLVTTVSNDRDLLLIWFGSDKLSSDILEYQQSVHIDCVSDFQNESVITNLNKESVYTFCLINMVNRTVSPFDCKSYYRKGEETECNEVWFSKNRKPLIIGVTIISLVSSIVVGMTIAAVVSRNNKNTESIRESISTVSHFGSMEAVVAPPAIPPHPKLGVNDDEVYYATVK